MSRVGLNPIKIEDGVTVSIDQGGAYGYKRVNAKGPKGELTLDLRRGVDVEVSGKEVKVTRKDNSKKNKSYHGLYRSLIANMIEGVSKGFEKRLEVVGVGYRANMKGTDLELTLGYNHPIVIEAPEGISFSVGKDNDIIVSGVSKELVGNTAAKIRELKKPEPYKGKGIRYEGEYVRRKAGKAGIAAA